MRKVIEFKGFQNKVLSERVVSLKNHYKIQLEGERRKEMND